MMGKSLTLPGALIFFLARKEFVRASLSLTVSFRKRKISSSAGLFSS